MKEDKKHIDGFLESGHLDENSIAACAEHLRGLTSAPGDHILAHLHACDKCRSEVMEIADLLINMDQLNMEEEEAIYDTKRRETAGSLKRPSIWRGLWRTAASVAAVALLAWFIQQIRINRDNQHPVGKAEDSVSVNDTLDRKPADSLIAPELQMKTQKALRVESQPDTIRFAEAFVPNPLYENLSKARYRAIGDPEVRGPGGDTVFTDSSELIVHWHPDPENTFEIIVINNKEKEMGRFSTDTTGIFRRKIGLSPGLYYWRFEGEEEVFFVGRFRIINQR